MISLDAFTFTNEEFLLLTLKSGVPINGLDYSAVSSMSEEQLRSSWETNKKLLQSKSYIGEEKEQSLEVDSSLLKLLEICRNPEGVFLLQIAKESKDVKLVSFYIEEDIVVSIERENELSPILLKVQPSVSAMMNHIEQVINLDENYTHPDENVTITLTKQKYYSFMAAMQMNNMNKAINLVQQNGISEEYTKDAIEGFANKTYFVSFSYYDSEQISEQVMFYQGERFLWGLEVNESEQSILQISSITKEDCYDSIKELLRTKIDDNEGQ